MSEDVDVAVVGAGIAGLTAARELGRAGLEVRVYEAAGRVAGRMASARTAAGVVDTGAEQLSPRGYQATWELLGELGFRAEDVPLIGKPIAIWRNGRAHSGFGSARGMLTGSAMSLRARGDALRLRVPVDVEHPERSALGTATVAELARRHHPEVRDYLLQPAASFCFWDVERSCAAVLLGMQRAVGDAAGWRTYRDGMDAPCRRMAEELDVVLDHPVREVLAERDRARLRTDAGEVRARQVLLCVPAPTAAELHANPGPEEAEFLAASTFSSALKAAFPLREPVQLPGRPYLLVTPRAEEDVLAGLVFDHVKHRGRVPPGRGLLTAMPNHERTAELMGAPDAEVISQLAEAVRRYVPGVRTDGAAVFRHPNALPEATPAALAALPRFRARPTGPVDYAGDWTTLRPYAEGAVRAAALAASRSLSRLGSRIPV